MLAKADNDRKSPFRMAVRGLAVSSGAVHRLLIAAVKAALLAAGLSLASQAMADEVQLPATVLDPTGPIIALWRPTVPAPVSCNWTGPKVRAAWSNGTASRWQSRRRRSRSASTCDAHVRLRTGSRCAS